MKRWALALGLLALLIYFVTLFWAREWFPALFPARVEGTMKSNFLTGLLLALAFALVGSIACTSLPTQHQQIAATCETAAAAADSIAAAAQAGRVSKAQAQDALRIYRTTTPFCEPEPLPSLTSASMEALTIASAQLASIAEKAR